MHIMHNQNEVTAKTFDEYKESYSDTVNNSIGFSGLDVDFFTRVKADYLVDICTKHFWRHQRPVSDRYWLRDREF